MEYAAWICSIETERTPARALMAMGAKQARKIRKSLPDSPIPNQMMVSGR